MFWKNLTETKRPRRVVTWRVGERADAWEILKATVSAKQTGSNRVMSCPKHRANGRCIGDPFKVSCENEPCLVAQP